MPRAYSSFVPGRVWRPTQPFHEWESQLKVMRWAASRLPDTLGLIWEIEAGIALCSRAPWIDGCAMISAALTAVILVSESTL